jgi:hypothetical protein
VVNILNSTPGGVPGGRGGQRPPAPAPLCKYGTSHTHFSIFFLSKINGQRLPYQSQDLSLEEFEEDSDMVGKSDDITLVLD